MDTAFLLFIVPAAIIVLAVLAALPSGSRIQRDPSTAYGGGRRALVLACAGIGLLSGLLLEAAGFGLDYKEVAGGLNMLHIGGASLLLLSLLVVFASWRVTRMIATASAGHEEEVHDVEGFVIPSALAPPAPAPAPSAAPSAVPSAAPSAAPPPSPAPPIAPDRPPTPPVPRPPPRP